MRAQVIVPSILLCASLQGASALMFKRELEFDTPARRDDLAPGIGLSSVVSRTQQHHAQQEQPPKRPVSHFTTATVSEPSQLEEIPMVDFGFHGMGQRASFGENGISNFKHKARSQQHAQQQPPQQSVSSSSSSVVTAPTAHLPGPSGLDSAFTGIGNWFSSLEHDIFGGEPAAHTNDQSHQHYAGSPNVHYEASSLASTSTFDGYSSEETQLSFPSESAPASGRARRGFMFAGYNLGGTGKTRPRPVTPSRPRPRYVIYDEREEDSAPRDLERRAPSFLHDRGAKPVATTKRPVRPPSTTRARPRDESTPNAQYYKQMQEVGLQIASYYSSLQANLPTSAAASFAGATPAVASGSTSIPAASAAASSPDGSEPSTAPSATSAATVSDNASSLATAPTDVPSSSPSDVASPFSAVQSASTFVPSASSDVQSSSASVDSSASSTVLSSTGSFIPTAVPSMSGDDASAPTALSYVPLLSSDVLTSGSSFALTASDSSVSTNAATSVPTSSFAPSSSFAWSAVPSGRSEALYGTSNALPNHPTEYEDDVGEDEKSASEAAPAYVPSAIPSDPTTDRTSPSTSAMAGNLYPMNHAYSFTPSMAAPTTAGDLDAPASTPTDSASASHFGALVSQSALANAGSHSYRMLARATLTGVAAIVGATIVSTLSLF